MDVAMETSAFSSSQTPRIMESTPTLPDGDCIVNVYDSMVADKGGVKVCDMIETWSEIEAFRTTCATPIRSPWSP
jgi:hypothetical protein